KLADINCYQTELWRHPEEEDWDDDWRWIVAIKLSPLGWLTWHIHDSEMYLFDWLPRGENKWDGHDTSAEYQRLEAFVCQTSQL
ncbi:MAG: hypothetical protein F6K28_57865, partial [Microcoleus sp. SIO2G3]|nr:hypothetical protein [Microcoleus sp. SIO2G3]